MGTKDTQIFGRFSRASALLVGLMLATAALSLVVLFSNPKPAEAAGETWYGTVDVQGTGTRVYDHGGRTDSLTLTNNTVLRFEAPADANNATMFAKIDHTENYLDPLPEDPTNCFLVQYKVFGTVRGPAEIWASDRELRDGNRYRVTATPNMSAPDEQFDNQAWTHWDYSGSCGSGADHTERYKHDALLRAQIYSGQNAEPYFRAGQVTDLQEESTWGHATPCGWGSSTGRECATFDWPAGAKAQWSLAANLCSGHSKAWNIGNGDKLVLFNSCQTKSLSARTSWLDDITGTPKVCKTNFSYVPDVSDWSESKVKRILQMTKKAATRLNQTCNAYKAVQRIQWVQTRWFMYHSAIDGATCGLWVVDDAPWRPPKVRPATNYDSGSYISGVNSGKTVNVKSANNPAGYQPVTC